MGLFGKWTNKEGTKPKEEAEAKKPEVTEAKTTRETGRERVEKMMDAAKSLWKNLRDKLTRGLERAKVGAADAVFAAVGGVEKGAIAGAAGMKAGVEGAKAAARYSGETAQESWELGKLGVEMGIRAGKQGVEATKDAARAIGAAGVIAAAGAVALAAELGRRGIEVGSKVGKEIISAATTLQEMGVDVAKATRDFGAEKLKDASNAAIRAKEAGIKWSQDKANTAVVVLLELQQRGIDFKRAAEAKGQKILDSGIEIYSNAKEKARGIAEKGMEAYDRMTARVSAAKDSFNNWRNKERIRDAKVAKLEGNIEELRSIILRLETKITRQSTLTEARRESPAENVTEAAG